MDTTNYRGSWLCDFSVGTPVKQQAEVPSPLLTKEEHEAGNVVTVFDGGPHTGNNNPPY